MTVLNISIFNNNMFHDSCVFTNFCKSPIHAMQRLGQVHYVFTMFSTLRVSVNVLALFTSTFGEC